MKLQATLVPRLDRRVASPSTAASRSFVVYMAYAASFVLGCALISCVLAVYPHTWFCSCSCKLTSLSAELCDLTHNLNLAVICMRFVFVCFFLCVRVERSPTIGYGRPAGDGLLDGVREQRRHDHRHRDRGQDVSPAPAGSSASAGGVFLKPAFAGAALDCWRFPWCFRALYPPTIVVSS